MRVLGEEIKGRAILIYIIFILFSILVLGLIYLVTTPETTVSAALVFAAGLSMILLPCTLPLVFIIVPMCAGQNYKKGLTIALLFGLGLTITITIYVIGVALIGNYFALNEVVRVIFIIAGSMAYIFGLIEIGKFQMPSMNIPKSIYKQGDYIKSFTFGLLLGNAGIGCPNPAFYVMLVYVAGTASVTHASILGFIHGIGRAVPLILFALLAMVGVNYASKLRMASASFHTYMGGALIFTGAFILVMGGLYPEWWEASVFHKAWNSALQWLTYGRAAETMELMGHEEVGQSQWYAPYVFIALILLPAIWRIVKRITIKMKPKNEMDKVRDDEEDV